METILATAFGRKIDIQRGEADELTKAASSFFEQTEPGQPAARETLVLMTSKFSPGHGGYWVYKRTSGCNGCRYKS